MREDGERHASDDSKYVKEEEFEFADIDEREMASWSQDAVPNPREGQRDESRQGGRSGRKIS
jgi:hypothetical protein